jgi:hypothetical protein
MNLTPRFPSYLVLQPVLAYSAKGHDTADLRSGALWRFGIARIQQNERSTSSETNRQRVEQIEPGASRTRRFGAVGGNRDRNARADLHYIAQL